jgi:D-arginine dehydrogenase
MVGDGLARWYFKPDGGQLLASPADQTPSQACDARADSLEIARAIEAINDCTSLSIRHVSTEWAGLRSFVADEMPVVGEWPEHPGFFFYAGQGGFGIQMAPALGVDADVVSPSRLESQSVQT